MRTTTPFTLLVSEDPLGDEDIERRAKRRCMAGYYEQEIKTGEIPCTAHRKRSYGLTGSRANKPQAFAPVVLGRKSGGFAPITPSNAPPASTRMWLNPLFPFKRERKERVQTGGAEYKERIPKGSTSLGNGVVMRLIKPGAKLAVGPYRRGLFSACQPRLQSLARDDPGRTLIGAGEPHLVRM